MYKVINTAFLQKPKAGNHPNPYQKKTNNLWSMHALRSQGAGRVRKPPWLLMWASLQDTLLNGKKPSIDY